MRRSRLIAPLVLVALAVGCSEDTTRPDPPPPPPQLSLRVLSEGSKEIGFRLRNNSVFGVFKDSQSRVWFATDEGLSMRPDGWSINDSLPFFDDFNGIPNRQTRTVTEMNGTIFVGTWGGGVAWFDGNNTFTALPVASNRVVANKIFTVAADDSSVWIGTVSGLTQYIHDLNRSEDARYIQRTDSLGAGESNRRITKVLIVNPRNRGTEVWCAKQGGGISVIRVGQPTQHFTLANSGIPGETVNDIAYDLRSDLFLSAYEAEGFAITSLTSWTRVTTSSDARIVSDLGKSVGVQTNGTRWLGTQAGLSRLDFMKTKAVNFTDGSGMPDLRIQQVYIAPDDQIWISFVEAGAGLVLGWVDKPSN